jgi:hypothetical protein
LFHLDPLGAELVNRTATARFATDVLGIVVSDQLLDLSDGQLGNPD